MLKAKQKAKAKKKKNGGDDDDFEDDSDEDEYTALSKTMARNRARNATVKPPVGSLENCAKCDVEFSVVRASPAIPMSYLPNNNVESFYRLATRSRQFLPPAFYATIASKRLE